MNTMLRVTDRNAFTRSIWIAIALAGVLSLASPTAVRTQAVDHAAHHQSPEIAITLATTPKAPVVGENTFVVTLKSEKGGPIIGADVTVEIVMPAASSMEGPEMRSVATLKESGDSKEATKGVYRGLGHIAMAGTWMTTVTAMIDEKVIGEKKLTLTVGP